MSAKRIIIGLRFGRGVVFAEAPSRGKERCSWVQCDCGTKFIAFNSNLNGGRTQSCGCLHKEQITVHGHASQRPTPTYRSWQKMVRRSTDPNYVQAKDYVERGITLCAGLRAFPGFLEVLGERPAKKVLDRCNNDGNYSCGKCAECLLKGWPLNVRWATHLESTLNRRVTRMFEIRGIKGCAKDLADHFQINYKSVLKRLKLGWDAESAFTKPVKQR